MKSFRTFTLIALLFMMTSTKPLGTVISVEYIKSKIIINETPCDSINTYFGKPIQKKFYQHVDFFFNQNDPEHYLSLSINFNDSIVSGKTTVKGYVIGTPGKGKIFST